MRKKLSNCLINKVLLGKLLGHLYILLNCYIYTLWQHNILRWYVPLSVMFVMIPDMCY